MVKPVKNLASGILSFLIALLVLELLCRVAFTIRADAASAKSKGEPWAVPSPELGWKRNPEFEGMINGVHRKFDQEGLLEGDTSKFTDITHRRILFIGDSNTFGVDNPAHLVFPAIVDSLMPDAVTINLAVQGYTSRQGVIVLQQALQRFRPDAIVASFNYNDRRVAYRGTLSDGPETYAQIDADIRKSNWNLLLDNIYIARALRKLLRSTGILPANELPTVSLDSLHARVSPENYRRNLEAIAGLARDNRIPVIFLLLGDNPIDTDYLRRGISFLQQSFPDSAIEMLRVAQRRSDTFRLLVKMYLHDAFRLAGRWREADSVGVMVTLAIGIDGGNPVRLDTEYHAIMRQVAEEQGAALLDGAALLNRTPSMYHDFCHFDYRAHRVLAENLAPMLAGLISTGNPDR